MGVHVAFFYNLKVHERSAVSFQNGIQKDMGLDIEKEPPRITLCKVPHKTQSLQRVNKNVFFVCCLNQLYKHWWHFLSRPPPQQPKNRVGN